ncbi:MAG TPA: TIR domain-containing protein [Caulobacteraceae bacterium]|jgi:TolB-like protein
MSDVFISYARSTESQARQVAEALRALGYGVWRDDELPAHRAYSEVIEERLEAAKAVVVLWSAEAVKSQWVRSEAERARGAAKLVQLVLDGARLPMPFDQIQCADLAGWSGDAGHFGWRKVVNSVADLIEPRAATAESAAASPPRRLAPSEPLLAVLAFDNPSADPEMVYFSDGVSQEILDTVARRSGVKVIGRASSFALQGEAKTPGRVAAALAATHVLAGSVRRAGPRVRISAELCECGEGRTLWSDRFDRDLSDIFAVQDEIAGAVAHALKAVFAQPERGPSAIDPRAYDLFLQSRVGQMPLADRVRLAEQAVALAPGFGQAWGWLGLMRARHAVVDRGAAPFAPLEAGAREAIVRAEALGLSSGITRAAASLLEPYAAYARREGLLDEALSASPSDPDLLVEKSLLLSSVGLFGDALAAARLARSLDPALPEPVKRCAILALLIGDWAEGQAACDELLARWPDDTAGITFGAPAAAHAGDWERLDELARFAAQQDPRRTYKPARAATVLMFGQAMRTNDAGFANLVQSVVEGELARDGAPAMEKLYVLAALGRVDAAYDLAERASFAGMFEPGDFYMSRGFNMDFLCSASHNAAMIEDPRFPRLCARIGLIDYWVSKDRWPACADAVGYDFRKEARRLATAAPVEAG